MVENKSKNNTTEEIINRFQRPLKAFIRDRVGRNEDAEDILQEVWLQLAYRDPKDELQSESGWLYRVARNKIIDHYRANFPDWLEDIMEDEFWEEEEDEMDTDYFWEELYEALDALPESQRTVFVQNEMEGLTLQEIAEESGEKLKTVISRKGYAVRKLRQQLGGSFDGF
ncbi:MAG: RNA polymerase sigma factor [Bacteroidia bacterium]|nr:RNA polymerase sigma factor [Bacteroidia bacterium]